MKTAKNAVIKLFYLLLVLTPIFSSNAQNINPNTDYKLKMVFPFGESKTVSICPINLRTPDGCCDGTQDKIYNYTDSIKGCCRQPNSVAIWGQQQRCCSAGFCQNGTIYDKGENNPCGSCCSSPNSYRVYGQASSCCTPVSNGQTFWGQTESSPCGGYCPPTQEIRTHQTFNSCCDTCSEVLAFQSVGNVCGTCCSRIPESCGNAGIRVCSPGTGSAYCSKLPDKCTDPDDWLIGSHGEGGYHCCDKCTNGKRYNQTNSDCGRCCANTSVTVTYGGITSCCTSLADRYNQTTTDVCGVSCPSNFMATYGGQSACCGSACTTFRSFQTTGNPCGTCCRSTTLNCGTAGTLMCAQGTGSRYCSPGTCGTGYVLVGTPATGYSCSSKAKPANASCTWKNDYWSCTACMRNGAFYKSGACGYNGAKANATCAASVKAYKCSYERDWVSLGNRYYRDGALLCSFSANIYSTNCKKIGIYSLGPCFSAAYGTASCTGLTTTHGYYYNNCANVLCDEDCYNSVAAYSCSTSKWNY